MGSLLRRVALGLALTTVIFAAWGFWWEPSSLTVTEQQLQLKWPSPRGPRIAVLSDLHVGSPFNGLDKLQRIVDETNRATPDVICILGDLVIHEVMGGTFVPPENIAAVLRRLKAPGGVFAVLGNHDGWFDRTRVSTSLTAVGIRVIEEKAERVESVGAPFWVAGLSDLWTGQPDLAAALRNTANDNAPVILLTHNPDIFPNVPARVTLTLAGHTHGGQVWLPFVGRPVTPSRFGQRLAAGLIVENGRHLFVATGLGTSIIPVRFCVRPSVDVLVIANRISP
jgi:predicted MPP superfamily phosphohydrolase